MSRLLLVSLVVVLTACPASSAQTLALVDDVEWGSFRDDCLRLLVALDAVAPLPGDDVTALRALLEQKKPASVRLAVQAVQKRLDAHCLLGVSINPESRVKAARGPRAAELVRDRLTLFLLKVSNDGGVTHPLAVRSDQSVLVGNRDTERWVEAAVVNDRPFDARLTGRRVEYRLFRLTARQAGKREATFSFDVGQGTQDLGFRSEVPVLFTIRSR